MNDVRGSGSTAIRQEKFEELGPIACAILRNHAHAVIRRHRDDHLAMWRERAHAMQVTMRAFDDVDDEHPVWSERPYAVFLYTPDDVQGRINYVNDNFEKHNLPREVYAFVKEHDGWPLRRTWKKQWESREEASGGVTLLCLRQRFIARLLPLRTPASPRARASEALPSKP